MFFGGVGDSDSDCVTDVLGHYGNHPYPLVTVKVTPSEMFKRVAPDKEGAADKQYLGR